MTRDSSVVMEVQMTRGLRGHSLMLGNHQTLGSSKKMQCCKELLMVLENYSNKTRSAPLTASSPHKVTRVCGKERQTLGDRS